MWRRRASPGGAAAAGEWRRHLRLPVALSRGPQDALLKPLAEVPSAISIGGRSLGHGLERHPRLRVRHRAGASGPRYLRPGARRRRRQRWRHRAPPSTWLGTNLSLSASLDRLGWIVYGSFKFWQSHPSNCFFFLCFFSLHIKEVIYQNIS